MTNEQPPVETQTPFVVLVGKLTAEGCRPRVRGTKGSAFCPIHDDSNPSLSIGENEGGDALLWCHAECDTDDVLAAINMTKADLFVVKTGTRATGSTRQRKRKEESPPAGPDDKTFGYVPACLLDHPCIHCIALYAYLARRCGKDNRTQRGWERIGKKLGLDPRTVQKHGEYLAGLGWLYIHARTTATSAHRSVEITLAHCPIMGIWGRDDVRAPEPNHASDAGRRASKNPHPLQVSKSELPASNAVRNLEEPASVAAKPPLKPALDVGQPRYVEVSDTSEVIDTYEVLGSEGGEVEEAPCECCGAATVRRDAKGDPLCSLHAEGSCR